MGLRQFETAAKRMNLKNYNNWPSKDEVLLADGYSRPSPRCATGNLPVHGRQCQPPSTRALSSYTPPWTLRLPTPPSRCPAPTRSRGRWGFFSRRCTRPAGSPRKKSPSGGAGSRRQDALQVGKRGGQIRCVSWDHAPTKAAAHLLDSLLLRASAPRSRARGSHLLLGAPRPRGQGRYPRTGGSCAHIPCWGPVFGAGSRPASLDQFSTAVRTLPLAAATESFAYDSKLGELQPVVP